MNKAPAPVTSIEEMSLNRLWAAPMLSRLSFNHLAVSGCTIVVPSDQLGRRRAGRQLRSVGDHDRRREVMNDPSTSTPRQKSAHGATPRLRGTLPVWAAHSPVAPHEQKAHEGRGPALAGQEKTTAVN